MLCSRRANNDTFIGRSCWQARKPSSTHDNRPQTAWDQFNTYLDCCGSEDFPLTSIIVSVAFTWKRAIAESALDGFAITYPPPLSKPIRRGWTISPILLMGCLAGFLRAGLSTQETMGSVWSRSARHSLTNRASIKRFASQLLEKGRIWGEINSLAGGFWDIYCT